MSELLVNKKNEMDNKLVGIDSLPDNVSDHILTCLPITKAIGTSLISRAWRYRWRRMPDLVFHAETYSDDQAEEHERKVVSLVNRVLLLHVGKIRRFEFTSPLQSFYQVDIWMHVLRIANIQELILRFLDTDYTFKGHKMPSTLFSCNNLRYLCLNFCRIVIPCCFEGFHKLTTIVFVSVKFEDESTFESLIFGCPVLQSLTLECCKGICNIKIVSTTLRDFSLETYYLNDLRFDAPMLASLKLNFESYSFYFTLKEDCGSLDIFNGLPNLEKLELMQVSLKVLALSNALSNMTVPFLKLKTLSVCKSNCLKQTTSLLCLLRISPELENLYIHDFESCLDSPEIPISRYWKVEKNLISFEYSCLRNLKISSRCQDARALINFLLPHAPLLGKALAYHGRSNFSGGHMFCYCSSK